MMIDSNTVQDLELMLNLKDYKVEGSLSSFFKCQTYGGYRLLRANILQPFKTKDTIVERQNLVKLLNDNNEFSFILQKCLSCLKRTDNITVKLMQRPKEEGSSIMFFYNLVLDVYFMLKKIISLCSVFEKMLEKYNKELIMKYRRGPRPKQTITNNKEMDKDNIAKIDVRKKGNVATNNIDKKEHNVNDNKPEMEKDDEDGIVVKTIVSHKKTKWENIVFTAIQR